ncbi:MAG: hypothetical protein HZA53_06010 [Planctomycetes bacterium]|nr:hypothetical protein [Planctomycetota bacterium]
MGTRGRSDWPKWWDWELELSSHVLKRRVDRRFTELDLRSMMTAATDLRPDAEPGRWVVETAREAVPWEVIVEPDEGAHLIVVITAYPVSAP